MFVLKTVYFQAHKEKHKNVFQVILDANYSWNLSDALQECTHGVQHDFQSFTEMLLNSLSDLAGLFLPGTACLHLCVAVTL